jgi:hypothetical protein
MVEGKNIQKHFLIKGGKTRNLPRRSYNFCNALPAFMRYFIHKLDTMIRNTIFLMLCLSVGAFAQKQKSSYRSYLDGIRADELQAHLSFIASDLLQGRKVGTSGERLAALYLATQFKTMGIGPAGKSPASPLESYFQSFDFNRTGISGKSQNVLAFIEGSDPALKNEVIVISAHYDHLGLGQKIDNDSIYNGAADDGSGTVVLLEVAEAIAEARQNGATFKRSILFLHAGGEESGLLGSRHFVDKDPVVSLDRIVANINLDGVGGTDKPRDANANNYVYILTVDSTSASLGILAKKINQESGINLQFPVPANPQRFTSDNKSFEYELIPAIYFSTGLTEHYHRVTDNPETINYDHMTKIAKLVFATTWELLSQPGLKNYRGKYTRTGKYFCPPCGCDFDKKQFDSPVECPACTMPVKPIWVKK